MSRTISAIIARQPVCFTKAEKEIAPTMKVKSIATHRMRATLSVSQRDDELIRRGEGMYGQEKHRVRRKKRDVKHAARIRVVFTPLRRANRRHAKFCRCSEMGSVK